jgi:hypothetical protein
VSRKKCDFILKLKIFLSPLVEEEPLVLVFDSYDVESADRPHKTFELELGQRLALDQVLHPAQRFLIGEDLTALASSQRREARLVTLPTAP